MHWNILFSLICFVPNIWGCTEYAATNTIQYFSSTGYDGSSAYSANINECHRIYLDQSIYGTDKVIQITRIAFRTEGTCCSSCSYDYVNIYDGHDSSSSSLVSTLCGTASTVTAITGTSDYMSVYFVTDSVTQFTGFQFSYQVYSGVDANRIYATGCSLLTATESYTYLDSHATYGIFDYSSSTDVCWIICNTTSTAYDIEVKFQNFRLESSSSCQYDSVKLYDGSDYSSSVLGTYCGSTNPGTIFSTDECMTVRFKTDGSITSDGYRLQYRRVDESYANSNRGGGGLSTGAIIGIVVAVIIIIIILILVAIIVVKSMGSKGRVISSTTGTVPRRTVNTISMSHYQGRNTGRQVIRPAPMPMLQPIPPPAYQPAQPSMPPPAYQSPPPNPYGNYPPPPPPPSYLQAASNGPSYPPPTAMYPPPMATAPPS